MQVVAGQATKLGGGATIDPIWKQKMPRILGYPLKTGVVSI
jgi:hypothetical protein